MDIQKLELEAAWSHDRSGKGMVQLLHQRNRNCNHAAPYPQFQFVVACHCFRAKVQSSSCSIFSADKHYISISLRPTYISPCNNTLVRVDLCASGEVAAALHVLHWETASR